MSEVNTMTTQTQVRSTEEALKLALEAAYLEGFNASGEGYNGEYPFQDNDVRPEKDHGWVRGRDNRINAIKEALSTKCVTQPAVAEQHKQRSVSEHLEPVAVIGSAFQLLYSRNDWSKGLKVGDRLYTTPPQPQSEARGLSQSKPLTDEQLMQIYLNTKGIEFYKNFARQIEAAHGIKE